MAGKITSNEGYSHSVVENSRALNNDAPFSSTTDILPVTKIPALDTIDPYVVNRPVATSVATSPSVELICSSEVQEVTDDIVKGYARFISSFTGLEEIAFLISRYSPFVLDTPTCRPVCATVSYSDNGYSCNLREVDGQQYNKDEIQFSLNLGLSSAPENGELQSSVQENIFALNVKPSSDKRALTIDFAYPTQLIPEPAISQLLKTVASHLTESSTSLGLEGSTPDRSILNFPPLMIPPSRDSQLHGDITSDGSRPSLLHAAFEGWAQRKPNAIALDFIHSLSSADTPAEHSILTYAALNTAATNLAVHIRTILAANDQSAVNRRVVPVYMTTSPELYISYLAILKAGCAFCPIPQDAPAHRVQDILRDIGSPIILGNVPEPDSGPWRMDVSTADAQTPIHKWVDVAEVSKWKHLQGDLIPESDFSDPFQRLEADESQTAYLLYTSGTTGKPKGVQVSHLSITCFVKFHVTAVSSYGDSLGDFRWFQFASPTFDPSLMEIFGTLSSGGTLCSAERSITLTDPEGTINEARATVMMATPSLAALLRPSRLTTLQVLWAMGEKLNRTVVENFAGRSHTTNANGSSGPSKMLINAYGPTEATILCTLLAPFDYATRCSIIGKALPTCSIFVLDPNSHEPKVVPAGLAGELAVGGPQVSKGYLNRPEETAKSFVHSDEFGCLYRTGDMGRVVWDVNGSEVIEFLGRITSDQVKLSGRRVELGEVESALATVHGVTDVVAVVSKKDVNVHGSEQIVACLVADGVSEDERQEIICNAQESAQQYLASYMRPSAYVFFDSLPRSSADKVDRKAISARIQKSDNGDFKLYSTQKPEGPADEGDTWSAADEETRALQQLVARLIGETADEEISSIKPGSDLFSLGIDSLGAMRLLQKLRDHAIEGLSVGDVLSSETPSGLVSKVAQLQQPTDDTNVNGSLTSSSTKPLSEALSSFSAKNHQVCADRLGLSQGQIQTVLPTTATQSGMLTSFLRSIADKSYQGRSHIYHSVLPLEAAVDLDRMRNAWDLVTGDYDSFRTVFCLLDDDMAPFAQCILTAGAMPRPGWNVYDMSADNSTDKETLDQALRDAEETINLDTPWKLSLIKTTHKNLLTLSMFHGIFDGGSLQLLLEDVASVYNGNPVAERTSLEHIVQHHFGADNEATAAFWNKHLEDYSRVAFPSVTSYRTPTDKATDCVEITAPISYDTLKTQSKNIGATPLSVLQAAWASILLAYTGTPDQDVVIGSVVSGRLDPASEVCVGPTFTIVPIRLAMSQVAKKDNSTWTNKSIARHLTSFNAKTLSHLQPRLGSLAMSDGRLPYDTLLAYQDFNAGSSASSLWGSVDHPPMETDFAVMIEVCPGADSSLTFRATFNNAVLDLNTAQIMLGQMADIVSFILETPEGNFLDAPSEARAESKSQFNKDAVVPSEVSEGALIHSLFEEHAESHPDDIALIFKSDLDNESNPSNVNWTYGQLNAFADELANHLLKLYGSLTNIPVPICIEKSPAMYVAILGILKAGGAWCPIDTLSPTQRRHDLIVRTSSKVLLVSSADGSQPEGSIPAGVDVVDVIQFATGISSAKNGVKRTNTKERTSPDGMAYLIWTSGTTGAPKGVPLRHSAAVSSFKSLCKDIPTDVTGGVVRCLQFSLYTFDVSIQDFFYTWSLGGVLISATREVMLSSFAKLANITKATHAHLTPAYAAAVPRKSCETLEVITMIGEKLPQPVADDWGTNMRAFNTYGPAEVTIVSTIREFGNDQKIVKSANIGWPMDTVSVFVTKNQRMVMKNAVGELALGGPQLSPGYLNQDDVTKAKYVWNEEASQIVYYTGDLVRMLADGSLEYLNRVDDLVKIGGIRVELSEISFALRDCHSSVETIETLILSRPDRPMQVVVAFLSAPSAASAGQEELLVLNDKAYEIIRAANDKAHASLPSHMIPSVYLVVKNIPRTSSAKTDRRALQAAYAVLDLDNWDRQVNPDNMASGQTSENEAEAAVAAQITDMIASLAGVSSSIITTVSRLGSLGIDSIRAIRLASRLKNAGYQLSVVDVVNCVTVQDLVKLACSSTQAENSQSENFDIEKFNEVWNAAALDKVAEDVFTIRATTIQESLLSETMGTYNMYWSNHFFSLDPSVDLTRLKQAWFAVCQKTEALRTGFIPVAEVSSNSSQDKLDFSILQLLYKLPALDWEQHQCTEQDWIEVRDDRIEAIMTKHQKNYFRHPPWAVTVFEKGSERTMVLTLHHSIHDEPSLGLIMDDVRAAYSYKPPLRHQLSNALSIVLPNEKRSADTRNFWAFELKNFAELDAAVWPDLTGKRVEPGVEQAFEFIAEEIPLTEPTTNIESAASKFGVSISSIIRAAWGYISVAYLGIPATVFAETLSDRVLHPDLDDGVGPLISVVPIPFHPQGSARDLLAEQHRISVQSWKYRHIHARDVRKMLNRPRGEPLYPAVFNFHVATDAKSSSQAPIWQEVADEVGLHVEHPMAFNVFQRADGSFVLEASSDSRMMSQEQLSIFVRQIDGLVSAMLASPDKPLAELVNDLPTSLKSASTVPVPEAVRDSVNTNPTYWLELHAQEHPEWTAVEVASSISPEGIVKESWTYETLNTKANRVAAFLASQGHKNRMIGVCCGRNLPSYPIIVGIFKSGNTYLPIDEGLPAERKAFLTEDSNSPIVFTEKQFSSSFSQVPEACRIICVDDSDFQDVVATMPSDDQDYGSHPDDLAYLMFTSGSTGKPKGVMVTRGNLSSFIESFTEFCTKVAPRTLKLGGTGRHLAQASRAFDPHLVEMFFPWRQGMATVTAPRAMILDDIKSTLSKWDITHASFVPSLVDQSDAQPEDCPNLVYMSVGGEKISKKVLDTWAESHIALANAYGPTEVTIGCTFAHVGRDTNMRNIGPPLTACVCHVFAPGTNNYVLRGQTGELVFSGDLVGKGYLNRPDATGFITGPNGEKMYRTGDIGRLMPGDSVEYLGRGDDQTKIRGQRLELGEVDEVLRSSSPVPISVVTTVIKHPGLARVQLISFIARSDSRRRQPNEGVAFIHSDIATLGKELQDTLKKKLPGYMVPELILPVTYIPLAPMSGKANLKELHALFMDLPLPVVLQGNNQTSQNGTAVNRPLTADEEAVVKEICRVISVDPSIIGPMTNIFEIGLDSLSAIGLSIKLRKIGYEATVALVLSNPVIEQLARLPRSSSSPNGHPTATELQQKLREIDTLYRQNAPTGVDLSTVAAVRPCLPLQEGLVARSINSEGDQLYINHVVLELESAVDPAQLKSAWQAVVKDNEVLRTTFAPLDKEIVQVVFSADAVGLRWTEAEYGSLEESLNKLKLQQVEISQEIITNISKAPPVRFHLAKSAELQTPLALFISIHHSLYDGESFSMLMNDVTARYMGAPVPERGDPSAFVGHVYGQDLEKAKQYWVDYLNGCRPTIFRGDPSVMELPKSAHRTLGNKLSELERRSASLQTTVPSLVQAIFALLLADTVGASDVTYGLVLSGRAVSVPGAESVLLPCITTIPGRLNTNGLGTVSDAIGAVQKSTIRSLDFQHTSLRHIQRWVKSQSPLFDCLFSYIRAAEAPEHNLWRELDSHMPAEYPLAVEVEANHATDVVNLNCLFSPSFGSLYNGDEFLEKLDAVLSSVVSGESLSLDNFNLPQSNDPGSRASSAQWDEATWSTTETKIRDFVASFCEVKTDDVSKGASFLGLGIDSVTAIQFARKLREAEINVSSPDVMRFSCVGALAQHVEQASTNQSKTNGHVNGTTSIPLNVYQKHVRLLADGDSVSAMFECTPLQSGMITQTLGSTGQVYVHPHPIRLADSVDATKLRAAVKEVIQQNEILRTSFHMINQLGSSWIGAVHSNPPFEWQELTLSSESDVLTEVSSLFSFGDESCFEVPPIRSVLVNQPEGRVLVVVMHHALYDGASLPFFFEDLATSYNGSSLSERPQFSDVVKHVLSGGERFCDFWVRKLLGYEVVELPQLPSSESSDRMFLSEHKVELDLPLIIEACKAIEVTVQSVALLAYAKTLARLIGKRDVTFGQVLAGRSMPGAERTFGPLFNTVAQRVTFEPKFLSNKAMALRLQQLTTDAQDYQHAPLREVQNSLRHAGTLKSTSLFDTLFVFQKSADFAGSILEEQEIWTPYETDSYAAQAEYKLNVEVDHGSDGIAISASCNGQYLTNEALDNFVNEFAVAFRDIIEHPTRCATVVPDHLGDLPLRLSLETSEAEVEESEAPPHEDMVKSVLSEISGIPAEHIHPSTSIFSIGLDSLSAIRIASVCRSKGLKTGVVDILQGNTLRGVSQRIRPMTEQTVKPQGALIKDFQQVEKTVLAQLNLQKEAVETILPCLGGQFFHLISWLKTGRKLFEPAWPYFTTERVDAEKLEEAWYQLRQRHPVLRTCFAAISPSEAVQIVMKQAARDPDTFKVIESSSPIAEAAKAQAKEEALHPSSLFVPPVRLRLLKASDRDGILVLVNHAAYDAWTMPMFVSELEKLYRSQIPETNPDFPAFVDYSVRSLREVDEKAYWTSALSGATETILHSQEAPQTQDQLFVGAWQKVKKVSELDSSCRAAGLSLQAVVLLSVARSLSRTTGSPNPTMGLYQTGRSASFPGIESLSGPCLNVNPFTISNPTNPEPSVLNQAQAVQASLAARVSFEQSSFHTVKSYPSTPQFNTWVNLLWMQNARSTSDPEDTSLFLPLAIGVPTDFIPAEPLPGLDATSVSALDTSLLPDGNVFIDIGPDPKTDSIGFGVRVEGGALSKEEVESLVGDIAADIVDVVASLQ